MKCCVECFQDRDIIQRIKSLNKKGTCDFCKNSYTNVLDLDNAEDIASDFEGLLDEFTHDFDGQVLEQKNYKLSTLSDYLKYHTSIFSETMSSNKILRFLQHLLPNRIKEDPALFSDDIIPTYLLYPEKIQDEGIFKGKTWNEFKEDIKFNNRFHSQLVNEQVLIAFFQDCEVPLKNGNEDKLFRARISDDGIALKPEELWAAPRRVATSGRLNASGIGYLYLSYDEDVCLKEIRASVNDVCTVATFQVTTDDLRVVDLGQIANISIFTSPVLSRYLMNYDILQDIDAAMVEFSKKDKSEIDLVPTEFMSDIIKAQDIDGIMYKSTFDNNFKNVVLFDGSPNNSKILQIESDIKTYRIKTIHYDKLEMR
ncbi:RES family NAD+ phosphorylase [Bombilactobacillus thymidiniphilus]|uniref:RES family NAD+ phosphorylase n=1 Tax=Bombilactobacillus thymidiniphilus TaxID=2923363 RepID=A0ABY4PC01_9LACO|nr:RES family NAD+ phosphorylase [Bombilactobacillus thymidiniphilus]UQS83071.1 RES family NAD+ phosphorylase [Bombilactobacillus thymidiniphilus]